MRAVTGAIVSSQTVSLAKAARVLLRFATSHASGLPPDGPTFLFSAAEAAEELNLFRRSLRRDQPDGLHADLGAEGGKKKHKKKKSVREEAEAGDGKVVERTVLGAGMDRVAEGEEEIADEKRRKKKKKKKRGREEEEKGREEQVGLDDGSEQHKKKKKRWR